MQIDGEDREALVGLSNEADVAKKELETEIADEEAKEKIPTDEQRGVFEKGKKLLDLRTEGSYKSPEYWALYSYLTEGFGEDLKWIAASEIVPVEVENMIASLSKSSEILEKEKELEHGSVEFYVQKSKIIDRDEALRRLMDYTGTNSEGDLRDKLKERNEDGDNVINIFTPEFLNNEKSPSLRLLRKIKDGGDALGYTFSNTPGYEMEIDNLIGRLRDDGKIENALEVERMFQEAKRNFENEKNRSEFQKIDKELLVLSTNEEKFKEYIEQQKSLPPDAIVHLYHGLNNGGYDSALEILNGPSHGIEQHSGPTVSLVPVGQFWKGVGFRYALRRDQIEFPGESSPNAVVRMTRNSLGDEGDGIIIHESKSLPLDQFDAEIMRSQFATPNPSIEKELVEKLRYFSEERNMKRSV